MPKRTKLHNEKEKWIILPETYHKCLYVCRISSSLFCLGGGFYFLHMYTLIVLLILSFLTSPVYHVFVCVLESHVSVVLVFLTIFKITA